MLKDLFKGINIGLGILLVFGLVFGIVYAVGFHSANEILGGTFIGNYIFNGSVDFTNASVSGISNSGNVSIGNLELYSGYINETDTVLLIQSNTFNGDTTFIDSSNSGYVITKYGDTHHNTSTSKFGNSSFYFDGTGDYLTIPDNVDWEFGSNDATIDFWASFDSIGPVTISQYESTGAWWEMQATKDDMLYMANQVNYGALSTGGLNTGEWHHFAFVKVGNTLYAYVDGSNIGSWSIPSMPNPAVPLAVSETVHFTPTLGYVDQLRITKGKALWTTNFVPDTSPYSVYYEVLKYKNGNNNEIIIQ